jgi:DNA-binding CsgD family transcriptional regulator
MSGGPVLSRWLDYVADVSRQPVSAFPTLSLLGMLSETFDATASWNWLQPDGEVGWDVLHPPAGWPPPGAVEVWMAHRFDHPLLRWYECTGSPSPMTMGRVPAAIADRQLMAFARDALGSPDMVQQLSIPVAITRRSHSVVVVSRGGTDFRDEEVQLARQLQPLVMLLERQAGLTTRLDGDIAGRFGLTARESSVLSLLRRGLTIRAIGRHLACAPRTVEKHLEHVYRKMDVRDRLEAVRVADAFAAAAADGVDGRRCPGGAGGSSAPHLIETDRADLLVFTGRVSTRVS